MARRVLVVDDHDDVRASIAAMLEADGCEVVATAADGDEAVALARRHLPELVLLDIRLPGPNGFAVARELALLSPPPTVVLMSSREARAYGDALAMSPALTFVTKGELSGAVLRRLLGEDVS